MAYSYLIKKNLYIQLMKQLENELPAFKFIPALSKAEEEWTGERGLITEVVGQLAENVPKCEAYLCGSPGMIDACVKVLTTKGLREDKIYYDKF